MSLPPVLETLADLVRINSVNAFYKGGPGEGEIGEWIEDRFARHGIESFRQEVLPGRFNVIARLPGKTSDRRIVLEAHADTVSVEGMSIPPFEPEIREGRLYGRGSCDTKAGLAAMIHALIELKEEGVTPPCEVLMAAVVDEEYSYRGVLKLCEDLRAEAAVVAEPTGLRCVVGTKGVLRWRIRVRGKAAHSAKSHLGRNAIQDMARILVGLEVAGRELEKTSHPLLGSATCNVGLIRGGTQVNIVPDECVIELDRRMLPGEQAPEVLGEYQRILDGLADIEAEMEPPLLVDEAFCTDPDSEVVRSAGETLESMGLESEPVGAPFGSDASKLSRAGVPSIVFGPGSIDQAHAAVEFVEIEQVLRALDFYRGFVLSFGS